jgi:Ca2+-binding RTX toxin-like protein
MAVATITLSANTIEENLKDRTLIGTLTVSDGATGETFTFDLGEGLDDRFEIIGNELFAKAGSLFDYEAANVIDLSISAVSNASAGGTVVSDKSFRISVTDVTEAPTDILLSKAVVSETAKAGTEVGLLTAVDPDHPELSSAVMPTFTLMDNAGGRFQIVDGKLVVAEGATFDFETAPSLQVKVKVTDAGNLSFEKTLTIGVTDVSEVGGSSRNEKLRGTEDADVINGGAGNDWIWGNGGDDVINGGTGKDILYGGTGADTFVFDSPFKTGHFDQIRDFKSGEDKIQFDLDALKAFKVKVSKSDLLSFAKKGGKPDDKGGSGKKSSVGLDKVFKEGKLEKKFFTVGTVSKDGNDFVVYNKKNGTVYLDVDGSGGAKPIEILKVKAGTTLSFNDFLFI